MSIKVFALGPAEIPITGQAACFTEYVSNSSLALRVFRHPARTRGITRATLALAWGWMSLIYVIVFHGYRYLYFTSARSNFGFFRDSIFVLTASVFGLTVVNHLHGADFKLFRNSVGPLRRRVIDFVYQRIQHHIVLTQTMTDQYGMYPAAKVHVIPNFAPQQTDVTVRMRPEKPICFLYLSNLLRSKGVLEAMGALSSLHSKFEFELHIAGAFMDDGYASAEELKSEFDAAFDATFMTYHGTVTGLDKRALFEKCAIFIFPTYYTTEAQPLAAIEAMSFGCAIISTRHNYIPDLLSPEFSILVPPKDVGALTSVAHSLLNNPDRIKALGQAAHRVSRSYSPKKYVKAIDDVFLRM